MAILTTKDGRASGDACSAEGSEKDWTYEYEDCGLTVTREMSLETVKRELGTSLFHNRNLLLEVKRLAQTLSSILRGLTQQENSLQTALHGAGGTLEKAEERDGRE